MGLVGSIGSVVNGHVSDALRSALRWGALILMALAVLSVHTGWKQRKAKRRLEAQCTAASGEATIFVALTGEHGTAATAQALYAVLDGAACPRRVRVGLYELLDVATGSALDMYRAMAERYSALGTSFADRVNVMRRFADDQGPYGALWELLTHAYRGEAYVLTLSDAAHVQHGWDTKLLELLARAPAPARTCLVLPPSGGYPVVDGFEDGVPTLGMRPWAKLDGPALPRVKFWTRTASFAPAGMWKGGARALPCRREPLRHLNAGAEVLLTADAMSSGWVLRSPARALPTLLAGASGARASSVWSRSTKASRLAAAALVRHVLYSAPLAPALAALSLHASVGRDAVMGIVDPRDEDEIEAKYSSVAEFLYIASKIEA